jgi:hypothetical protein
MRTEAFNEKTDDTNDLKLNCCIALKTVHHIFNKCSTTKPYRLFRHLCNLMCEL